MCWFISTELLYSLYVCNQPFIWVAWVKISVCFTNRIYPFETFEFFCSFEIFELFCSCIRGPCVGRWTRWRISGACRSWVTDRTRNWGRNSHKLKEHDFKKYLKVIGADSSEPHSTGYKGGTIYVTWSQNHELFWSICQIHLNELPLRQIFAKLDDPTSRDTTFNSRRHRPFRILPRHKGGGGSVRSPLAVSSKNEIELRGRNEHVARRETKRLIYKL